MSAVANLRRPPKQIGDEWCTPPIVWEAVLDFARLAGHRGVALDPCAGGPGAVVTAATMIRVPQDGLLEDWVGLADDGLIYVNPPYSAPAKWIAKCEEAGQQTDVIALVPNSAETEWWRWPNAICFWRGRLSFLHPDDGKADFTAGKGSALLYWGDKAGLFEHAFRTRGRVVRP